jgi:hypothetical protein
VQLIFFKLSSSHATSRNPAFLGCVAFENVSKKLKNSLLLLLKQSCNCFIYLFIHVYCPYAALGYERPTPHLLTDINIHSDAQAEPRKLSSLTLYIDLWQEGKPAPGQNPVISPPVVIFRRIGVRAEIRTQNPVLSNTRLAKMVPLSHLRRHSLVLYTC